MKKEKTRHNRTEFSPIEVAAIKKFGFNIKKLRLARGLTLEQTEEKGFPSWRHLSQIENGEKNVTLVTILRIAKVFKVSPQELLDNF